MDSTIVRMAALQTEKAAAALKFIWWKSQFSKWSYKGLYEIIRTQYGQKIRKLIIILVFFKKRGHIDVPGMS